ncbi:MAG: two-component system response regulator [Desulfuromonas sp.]|nr:MAG: two-component system response regulator [Desulfuromonas sp.]
MRKKILIVDDSATVRQVLSTTLRETGYEVVEASDGQEALAFLDERQSDEINMLITDLNMPKMDGIDLIRQVRGSSGFRFMPIIMLTTESQDQKKQEGKSAGASGWIVKPVKPEQLRTVISMVMS